MSIAEKKPFTSGLVEGVIDPQVYHDVLKTHAKEAITFLDYGNTSITRASQNLIAQAEFTECEISPFHKNDVDCTATSEPIFSRQSSLNKFAQRKIAFTEVQKLLIDSFSPAANGSRPYPSAGGLYPVEPLVFLFEEGISDGSFPSGCYHFRPVSKQLQLLKRMSRQQFIAALMHGFVQSDSAPSLIILYLAHVGKSIFKYRYRGYRHAMMEAGSMYQQATFISQQMSLRTTLWSTFSEHQMLYEIGLDYGTYLPITMQFFGYGEEQ